VAAPTPAREEPAPPPVAPPAASPPAAAAAPRPSPVAADAGAVTADASICVTLSRTGGAWRCEPPDAAATPDALYYYTRVKSARDIVVRHRWTHEGTVVQTVSLRIAANPRAGFRTFSRQTLRARGPGRWEVALIGPDGATLDAQRFERH
jgi:hypothetical protein